MQTEEETARLDEARRLVVSLVDGACRHEGGLGWKIEVCRECFHDSLLKLVTDVTKLRQENALLEERLQAAYDRLTRRMRSPGERRGRGRGVPRRVSLGVRNA